jgi:hypothetical protein
LWRLKDLRKNARKFLKIVSKPHKNLKVSEDEIGVNRQSIA